MEYHDFICLLKDTIIPLLPLIWKPACLSFEGQDCDQLQLDLRMLLSAPVWRCSGKQSTDSDAVGTKMDLIALAAAC